jgi:chromosome segregation ATPase
MLERPAVNDLVRALEGRLSEANEEHDQLQGEFADLQHQMDTLTASMARLQREIEEIETLRNRYLAGSGVVLLPVSATTQLAKLSVSEAILVTLTEVAGHQMAYEELIRRVGAMRDRGAIDTDARSDNRKLIASHIGNLIRAGRLDRRGDMIGLLK